MTARCAHRWVAFLEMSQTPIPMPIKRWKRCQNVKCRRRVNLSLESEECIEYERVSVYDVPTIRPAAP